jgi:hypothetical protein
MQRNNSAREFWRHATSTFAGDAATLSNFEKNGERWDLFSFESPDSIDAGPRGDE